MTDANDIPPDARAIRQARVAVACLVLAFWIAAFGAAWMIGE